MIVHQASKLHLLMSGGLFFVHAEMRLFSVGGQKLDRPKTWGQQQTNNRCATHPHKQLDSDSASNGFEQEVSLDEDSSVKMC